MSASIRPTFAPVFARASARLAATVDLPTPPLPLATATTWRTPGSSIRGGAWGGRIGGFSGSARRQPAQLAQVLEGVDAGVVPVAPDDLVGVPADARHTDRRERDDLAGLEDAERVGRLLALVAAAGAGAGVAQVLP